MQPLKFGEQESEGNPNQEKRAQEKRILVLSETEASLPFHSAPEFDAVILALSEM